LGEWEWSDWVYKVKDMQSWEEKVEKL
jgi:hypothetical protein